MRSTSSVLRLPPIKTTLTGRVSVLGVRFQEREKSKELGTMIFLWPELGKTDERPTTALEWQLSEFTCVA